MAKQTKRQAKQRRDHGTGLIDTDPLLEPYADRLRLRWQRYQQFRDRLEQAGGLMGAATQGHRYFGFNRGEKDGEPGVWYREWAPGANYLALVGDFNGWDRGAEPMTRDDYGVWHLFLPDAQYADRLTHGSRVKVHVGSDFGGLDRIPAYIERVVQEENSAHFVGQYWQPETPYPWQHARPRLSGGLRVYEAHVGMAQEEGKVGTYAEFTRDVLPRIRDLGYNAVQLMAVMEHPFYGSFGYHVSNF
ncbi:MAG: 1,4-alpha-glucan-branching enzyme, partial [Phycisphaeraceae bacterium]